MGEILIPYSLYFHKREIVCILISRRKNMESLFLLFITEIQVVTSGFVEFVKRYWTLSVLFLLGFPFFGGILKHILQGSLPGQVLSLMQSGMTFWVILNSNEGQCIRRPLRPLIQTMFFSLMSSITKLNFYIYFHDSLVYI